MMNRAQRRAMKGNVGSLAATLSGRCYEIHGAGLQRVCDPHAIKALTRAFALSDKIGRNPVSCHVSDTDRYGRAVATCYVGDTDLNAWMVRNGWAVAYRQYGTQYVNDESRARADNLGIWASQFVMPWDWRRFKRGG